MDNEWLFQVKGGLTSCEMSLVRKDNKHGQASYGWPDKNKIIIVSYNRFTEEEFVQWCTMGQVMALALNNLEINASNGGMERFK